MTELHLLVYYALAFLLEEDLFIALRKGGITLVWRKSRLISTEFCLLYYPVIAYFWVVVLPPAGAELRQACLERQRCRGHLRLESAWWAAPATAGPDLSFFDAADIQWRDFRDALPTLLPAAMLLAAVVRIATSGHRGSQGEAPGVQLRAAVGCGFLLYVHGAGAVFPLVLLLCFYSLARASAGSVFLLPSAWLLALGAIAAKEPKWPIRRHIAFGSLAGKRWSFLDGKAYQGEYDWAESVNLMVLRLLSFALDSHRAAQSSKAVMAGQGRAKVPPVGNADQRPRYTLVQCCSHAFYAPLFLAGPTIGFDDFVHQCITPRPLNSDAIWYLVQLCGALVTLEMGTHLYPCFALARSGEIGHLGPRLDATAVFFALNLMYLKFLVIWRIARAWALVDGIDPPENMRRALCNHYSVTSFWQCWHASYNRWLVRYIYVPLGGRTRRVLATVITFLFVAIWHDAEAKLLAWGGLNAVVIAIEQAVVRLAERKTESLGLVARRPWLHRQLCALGGTQCIFLLMVMNSIGYSAGLGGISNVLASAALTRAEAAWIIGCAQVVLFSGVQVMLEVRRLDGTSGAGSQVPLHGLVAWPALPRWMPSPRCNLCNQLWQQEYDANVADQLSDPSGARASPCRRRALLRLHTSAWEASNHVFIRASCRG